jgi:hypothetical protein
MRDYYRRLSAALAGTALATTAVLAGAPASVAAPAYKVDIIYVECHDQEEWFGPDHVFLTVDGKKVWGPKAMVEDQTRRVTETRTVTFTTKAKIRLYEDDDGWDTDDFIDHVTVSAADAGDGEKEATLVGKGANYTIGYKVVPVP